MVDFPNLSVDNAYRVWMRERSAHLWLRLEDLLEGGRAEYELRRVLDFALDGQYHLKGNAVRCSLRKATARLRAANKEEKEELKEGLRMVMELGTPGSTRSCGVKI